MGTHNGKILDAGLFSRNTKKQQLRNRRSQMGFTSPVKGVSDDQHYRKSCSDFYVERGQGKRCPHKKHWTVIAKR